MASRSSDGALLFAEGASGTLRLVAYLSAALALMVADHRGRYLDQVRAFGATLAGPVYWIAAAPSRATGAVYGALIERRELARTNSLLHEQLLLAEARLSRLAAVQDQNNRLRGLLQARSRLGLKVQLAELVDVDLDPFRHRLVIDAGSNMGVKAGQAVMDAHGVMGQILEVSPERSVLILVTDASHALPVRVVRTGLRTIAYGSGDITQLRLPHIPFSADLRPGDKLVTSGVGGQFPAGLPVGVVRTVTPDDSATFALALASPSAGLTRSGEVLLLHEERGALAAPVESEAFVGPPEAMPVEADAGATTATGGAQSP